MLHLSQIAYVHGREGLLQSMQGIIHIIFYSKITKNIKLKCITNEYKSLKVYLTI